MLWFFCPTRVYLEPYAVKNNAAAFDGLGKRCLAVTGKTSAAASGAMDDLSEILKSLGVACEVFNEVEPNPSIHACREGGRRARAFGAEFIVGAGGGSAIDAAKAVAAYAANDMEPMAIFDSPRNPPLRVVAIPTTAGTGSEVNGYAILTIPEMGVKRTYSSPLAFPVAAFLDPRYTASLPYGQAVSTALDAFCHCAESYFSPKSTPLTRALGVKGANLVWRGLLALEAKNADEAVRTDLLTGAMLGGICIAHAGTGYPHPMGYNLTLYRDIPHGAACAIFEGGYLRRQAAASGELFGEFLRLAGLPDEIPEKLPALAGPPPRLTAEEIARYAGLIAGTKNFANSVGPVAADAASIVELYEEILCV
jgi:alcohol dehydrogenase class IV